MLSVPPSGNTSERGTMNQTSNSWIELFKAKTQTNHPDKHVLIKKTNALIGTFKRDISCLFRQLLETDKPTNQPNNQRADVGGHTWVSLPKEEILAHPLYLATYVHIQYVHTQCSLVANCHKKKNIKQSSFTGGS